MSSGSQSIPIFLNSAQELVELLRGDLSLEALPLRVEAEELVEIFLSWTVTPPDVAHRSTAVNRLLVLYREVLNRKK